jgi:mono/diheme cytochrome c family protein
MFNYSKLHDYIKLSSLVVLLVLVSASTAAFGEEELIGSDEYRISCLSCHGVGGKGDGPMAKYLTIKPTDLTQLSKNNGGQYPDIKAGSYPFLRVFQIIDGRTEVAGHGDRPMPVWGSRFQIIDQGPPGTHEREIRARILELVYYIQSIQED